jgi:E3 ubiquitin-protein ligase BRE1
VVALLDDEGFPADCPQCVALRSQMDVMRVRLEDSEVQRDKYHAALVATENRLDRLRSGTVLKMQSRGPTDEQEPKEEAIEEPQRKPSSPAVSGSVDWWESWSS